MKKISIFIVLSIIILLKPKYTFSIEPDVFIQSTVNRAAQTLSGNLSKNERIEVM